MRTFISRTRGACAGAALSLAACGGGADGPGAIDLASQAALDGFVNSVGNVFTGGSGPGVGDIDPVQNGLGNRMFYSFDLASVPPSATEIVSATLEVSEEGVSGNPFATLGVIVVDHLDYGPTLDAGDYALPALDSAFGVFSGDAVVGYHGVDVTGQVRADWGLGRPRSQFRLRFAFGDSDFDGAVDFVGLNDQEDSQGSGRTPFLSIRFR